MIEIDGVPVLANVSDILYRLKREMALEGKSIFNTISNKNNSYLMVTCPFHNNTKAPDMQISKVKSNKYDIGFSYCHGCHHSSSLVELVSEILGYHDFGVAGKNWILSRFSSFELDSREGVFNIPTRNHDIIKKEYVSKEELAKYRYTHPYMYYRHLNDYIIDWYDVGYDNNTDSITFPVKDINGNCLFIAERNIKQKIYHYPKDVDKPIYGIFEANKIFPNSKYVYICESMLNTMVLTKNNIPSVALLGTGTSTQYELLKNLPYRKYVLCLDHDEAGLRGTKKLIEHLSNNKLLSVLVTKDKSKDINDLGYCNDKQELLSNCEYHNDIYNIDKWW